MCEQNELVTASLVADDSRLDFLPFHFGTRHMLRGEAMVYGWMRLLCKAYDGGYWNFYTLSNGGFYMAPDFKGPMRLEVDGNGFRGNVSADAAGVIVTLFALCYLAEELYGTDGADAVVENYHRLREFVDGHREARAIFRAID
ncbi:antirestriction protein [Variovorax sp. J2P1-59]|uniref:antirestriction protein n=1 Tax=Variovorax flavidus TaxID=3053501 RepID=UPI0025752EF1|nr:antirestriction protein [Variovorax sp. J2P1-59]MDM0078829.1 antirestriction protein [Variovorax sp. J2P1-59]